MLPTNPVAEILCASVAAVIWCFQVVPPIIAAYRTKSTQALSPWMMLLWAGGALLYAPYAVAQNLNIAIIFTIRRLFIEYITARTELSMGPDQLQPHIFYVLTCTSFIQCLHYTLGQSRVKAGGWFLGLTVLFAGFDTGSIFALRRTNSLGLNGVAMIYGYGTSVLDMIGFIPQYIHILRIRHVPKITILFGLMDLTGCVLSMLSLLFRRRLDIAGFVFYLSMGILDLGLLSFAIILNPLSTKKAPNSDLDDTDSRIEVTVLENSEQIELRSEAVIRIHPSDHEKHCDSSSSIKDRSHGTPTRIGNEAS
ncbi:hypothetical protein TREMEDRAFT_62572 [Tremella mesenterica DSM 1558]|uniref:uncharacterized protein n=1 Tax=Tremella mesenterica (strain ATCC 24925 / CBS 8224 / DSM 1558 / NBRC 9311 / NRRL Y-6157 / RJB 2259-6 / UBC 559-6) TaxID=578456 RepID=UPI0003F49E17|nr:uncharacterized protein TREMEDRAFT_62572 [Tremella mesenterica DSM 1558]EIW69703.1 hypothetical protein TREMEDRAFT_62572 [Tremella mesenterica DSM 1558]